MSRWISLDARSGGGSLPDVGAPTDGKVNRGAPTDGTVKREPGRWREVEMGQDVTERGRTKHLSFGGR